MTTATAWKTSLGNKHLPNCDYLRLPHLVRVLNCWQSALQLDWYVRREIKDIKLKM